MLGDRRREKVRAGRGRCEGMEMGSYCIDVGRFVRGSAIGQSLLSRRCEPSPGSQGILRRARTARGCPSIIAITALQA